MVISVLSTKIETHNSTLNYCVALLLKLTDVVFAAEAAGRQERGRSGLICVCRGQVRDRHQTAAPQPTQPQDHAGRHQIVYVQGSNSVLTYYITVTLNSYQTLYYGLSIA